MRPLAFTVAIAVFEDDHVNVTPLTTALAASRAVAVAWSVLPATAVVLGAVTVTVATTGVTAVTVTDSAPDWPPPLAVIVAEPAPTAVTRPLASTVATAVFDDVHVNVTPLTRAFDASRAVAVACSV